MIKSVVPTWHSPSVLFRLENEPETPAVLFLDTYGDVLGLVNSIEVGFTNKQCAMSPTNKVSKARGDDQVCCPDVALTIRSLLIGKRTEDNCCPLPRRTYGDVLGQL
jgi:hypothetical protein